VRKLMQTILDRYKVGVEVSASTAAGGVRPPEQVQAASTTCSRPGQERERCQERGAGLRQLRDPLPVGTASRSGRAEAYKARIVAQAQGDAQRFARADRIPEGSSGHARPHVHRFHAADLTATSPRCWSTLATAPTCCNCRWTESCSRSRKAVPSATAPEPPPSRRRPPLLPFAPNDSRHRRQLAYARDAKRAERSPQNMNRIGFWSSSLGGAGSLCSARCSSSSTSAQFGVGLRAAARSRK
jgi:hypothetical protein